MAVAKCQECKKDVSTTADKCPHCGAPAPDKVLRKKRSRRGCAILLILLAASVIAAQCIPDSDHRSSSSLDKSGKTGSQTPVRAATREEQEIARLDAKAKSIPATDVAGNLAAYRALLALAPDNEDYRTKVAYYESPAASAAAARLLADSERNKQNAPVAAQSNRKTEAWIVAKQCVEKQLKAPSTANWGSIVKGTHQSPDLCVTVMGDDKYLCKGWVDSQNSFGAMIRTSFECTVQYKGDDRWTTVDLRTW